jgi:hypothetical protein
MTINNTDPDQNALVQAAFNEGHAAAAAYMAAYSASPGGGVNPDDLVTVHTDPPLPAHIDVDAGTQGMRGGGERP